MLDTSHKFHYSKTLHNYFKAIALNWRKNEDKNATRVKSLFPLSINTSNISPSKY